MCLRAAAVFGASEPQGSRGFRGLLGGEGVSWRQWVGIGLRSGQGSGAGVRAGVGPVELRHALVQHLDLVRDLAEGHLAVLDGDIQVLPRARAH